MARDTTTTASNFYKTLYRDFMASDVPMASKLSRTLEKRAKHITAAGTSLNATWQHKSADGVGMTVLSEAGDFAQPVASVPKQMSLGLAHCQFTVGFTGHLEAQGKSKAATWTGDYVKMKGRELRDKARSVWARFLLHDGTANFGQITAVSGTTNGYITVDTAPIHFYVKQEELTIRDTASSGSEQLTGGAGSGVIQDVDYINGRIYLADVSGAAIGDYVALANFYDSTVPNGIENIASASGTIQGLARATVGNFLAQATYVDAGSTALTADQVDSLRDTVEDIAGTRDDGGYNSMWVCDRQMRRWMALATIGYNRFAGLDMTLGTPSMKVGDRDGEKMVIEDPFVRSGKLFAICPDEWVIADPEGMKGGYPVVNGSGGVFFQGNAASGVGHADHKLMYWIWRRNAGCDNFRAQGQRDNIVSP